MNNQKPTTEEITTLNPPHFPLIYFEKHFINNKIINHL